MAIPWLSALKVIPWGDVISHAPGVLEKARDLMARKTADAAPQPMATPNTHDEVPSLGELKKFTFLTHISHKSNKKVLGKLSLCQLIFYTLKDGIILKNY